MQSARDIYNVTGPTKATTFTFTGAGQREFIPENRDRIYLRIIAGLVPCNLLFGTNILTAITVKQIAANETFMLNVHEDYTFVGEPFILDSTGVGNARVFQVFYRKIENQVMTRGVVEEYRKRLLERKRQQLRQLAEQAIIPSCAALLLESPVQFAIRQEQETAIGGGGGETGSEPLATASPDLIGD